MPGYTVRERTLAPADLEGADEVFITSTTRNLLPAFEIEGRAMTHSGPACAALEAAFQAFLDAYVAGHKEAPAARR